jgi:hypothetical protein
MLPGIHWHSCHRCAEITHPTSFLIHPKLTPKLLPAAAAFCCSCCCLLLLLLLLLMLPAAAGCVHFAGVAQVPRPTKSGLPVMGKPQAAALPLAARRQGKYHPLLCSVLQQLCLVLTGAITVRTACLSGHGRNVSTCLGPCSAHGIAFACTTPDCKS